MISRSKIAAFTGALILAGSVFAAQGEVCPSLSDIQAEGLTMSEEIGPDIYLGYNISEYNTAYNWGFVIAPLEGDSADMALEVGNEILSSMSASGVPQQHRGGIICEYNTGNPNVIAAAIRDDQLISPMSLKAYIKGAR